MNYSKLENERKIKRSRFSKDQIEERLVLAHRDLDTANKSIDINSDWCFSIAYNAMLQASRALMFSKGYRAVGEGQHASTIEFAGIALGRDFADTINLLDRMRRKRNTAVYDIPGLISSKEATEAIETAGRFVNAISEVLDT